MGIILEPFIWVIGKILEGIYFCFSSIGIENVGVCIIALTIIVRMLMLPMTIKQQKSSKMNSIMSPEIKAIQAKYKDKKDQQSQLAMNEETRAVYDKYGVSMTGSCLQLIIQLPIMFALYRVIMDMQSYINSSNPDFNKFLVYNLKESPSNMVGEIGLVAALAIPVLAGISQFASVQLSTKMNSAAVDQDNPMAGSMKTMNYIMPLMSVLFCWGFATGIGIYWVIGSVVMMVQQIFINIYYKDIDVNQIIEKNKEKAAAKQAKRKEKEGIYREQVMTAAKTNAKNISSNSNSTMTAAEKEAKLKKASEYGQNAKKGSIASRANMVNDYKNKNNK